MKKRRLLIVFIFGFLSLCFADETLTITTYYPSPYGVYRELRSQRMAIGDNYIDGSDYCWDGSCTNTINANADLVVEGRVGIGTTNPGALLDVNYAAGIFGIRLSRVGGASDANNWYLWNMDGVYGNDFEIWQYPNDYSPEPAIRRLEIRDNGDTLLVPSSGNVGIGTQNPTTLLYTNFPTTSFGDVLRMGNVSWGTHGVLGINAQGSYWNASTGSSASPHIQLTPLGLLGIGTTNPQAPLHVYGNSTLPSTPAVYIQQAGAGTYLQIGSSGVFTVIANGNVGIGMTGPNYQLELSKDSAAKPGSSAWSTPSDRRVKKDIRPYTNGLSIIKRINPVWFKYNGKAGFPNDNQDHIGVIGQEIAKVAPYTVNTFKAKLNPTDKQETELLNFNSHALTFDLINAVKELDANITRLAQENQELKSELDKLKTRLSHLEAR